MASEQAQPDIDLNKLNLNQLAQLKEQFENDITMYSDSISNLRTAMNRFNIAANAVCQLGEQAEGKKVMVPLTSSLYVPGELVTPNKVLIDIGTNYFVERTAKEGVEYCERKLNFVKGQHDKLVELVTRQREILEQVTMCMQAKVSQQVAGSSK